MAQLFKRDPDNERRLVVKGYPDHTLRGFLHPDGDQTVTITVEWGPSGTVDVERNAVCMTGRLWPGGAILSNVVRPWRRSGDWHAVWNETRRQVRDICGVDIGEPPHNTGPRKATATAAAATP